MKKVFLLIVIPALLVALGFAQTPAASINTDQTNIKGCLGGSDGNYTIAQDNTGHIFKVTSSSVDLKPHLGHDVTLIGHKASSAATDSSLAVTELNMISEHCAAAAAAPIATVSTPSENAVTPAATVSTPAETAIAPAAPAAPSAESAVTPAATVSTPAETAIAPAAPAAPSAESAVTPAVPATAPAATVTTPAETAVTPAVAATAPSSTISTSTETPSTPTARPRRPPATPAAATTKPAVTASKSSEEPVSKPAATAAPPEATASTSSEPVSTPAAAATTPTAPARRGSLSLLILFAVLVLVIGILTPPLNRWRKRKILARTGAPNLSLTREASSDQDKTDTQVPRKAA